MIDDPPLTISNKDMSYFRIAKNLSELSDHRTKVGCAIVSGHRIISSGHNSDSKCHKIQADIDRKSFHCDCPGKLHAESDAIIYCIKNNIDLSRATIYVYRELKDGTKAMARPCPRCMRLIKEQGIRKIKYSTDEGYASEIVI